MAAQCDTYVHSRCPSYPARRLHDLIRDSVCCKARLLHYFPMDQTPGLPPPSQADVSDW